VKADGKVLADKYFIFFNNMTSPDGAIRLTGDNLTGEGEGDDETVIITLGQVPAEIEKIVVPVSIYDAASRGQNFGQVRNAYIRVVDQTGKELVRYDLSEDYSTETVVIFGEVYRNGAEWKFRAVGQGHSDLGGLARDHGVNI
jgi:tellurium resistance protein TerD